MWSNKVIIAWVMLAALTAACYPHRTDTQPTVIASAIPPCPDMLAIVKDFLDSNDAARYDESLDYLTRDVSYTFWAEGVNGRHWQEKHLSGWKAVRPFLSQRGLRRTADKPYRPIFNEDKPILSGDRISIMLQPDRLSPRGREYNPYQVEAAFDGCKIKSLKVIEFISWE